jgi:hypothetical protein
MREINIALLADPSTGGWPTFTAHLNIGLRELGYDCLLYRLAERDERNARPFGRGLSYHNIRVETAVEMSRKIPTIIAAVGPKYVEAASRILRHNTTVVIHDPTELSNDMKMMLRETDKPVIIIRKTNKQHLQEINNVIEVLHPYARSTHIPLPETKTAVAYSRLDWDKNTHIIVEANLSLPIDKQIKIYGNANRMYTHHKLEPLDPDWERNYRGGWSPKATLHHPVKIAQTARAVVDLSVIKGDGGGTQYTFLEAFDAQKPLIIHSAWLTGDTELDEITPAISGTVSNANELINIITSNPTYNKEAAEHILHTHEATKQAKTITEALSLKP